MLLPMDVASLIYSMEKEGKFSRRRRVSFIECFYIVAGLPFLDVILVIGLRIHD
jgi:hypothetical protein